jgi:hypothetical protein
MNSDTFSLSTSLSPLATFFDILYQIADSEHESSISFCFFGPHSNLAGEVEMEKDDDAK